MGSIRVLGGLSRRIPRRHILLFINVIFQIVQFQRLVEAETDAFPIAPAHGLFQPHRFVATLSQQRNLSDSESVLSRRTGAMLRPSTRFGTRAPAKVVADRPGNPHALAFCSPFRLSFLWISVRQTKRYGFSCPARTSFFPVLRREYVEYRTCWSSAGPAYQRTIDAF